MTGAVKAYIRRMLADCGVGMKALILDQTTVRVARGVCGKHTALRMRVQVAASRWRTWQQRGLLPKCTHFHARRAVLALLAAPAVSRLAAALADGHRQRRVFTN